MNQKQTIFITIISITALIGLVYTCYYALIDMINPYSYFVIIDMFIIPFGAASIILLGVLLLRCVLELLE